VLHLSHKLNLPQLLLQLSLPTLVLVLEPVLPTPSPLWAELELVVSLECLACPVCLV